MMFSRKNRLEEEEVKKGETSVLRRFASENVMENPHDSLAGALNLVMNQTTVQTQAQSAVTIQFRANKSSHFQGIPVYERYLSFHFLSRALVAKKMSNVIVGSEILSIPILNL